MRDARARRARRTRRGDRGVRERRRRGRVRGRSCRPVRGRGVGRRALRAVRGGHARGGDARRPQPDGGRRRADAAVVRRVRRGRRRPTVRARNRRPRRRLRPGFRRRCRVRGRARTVARGRPRSRGCVRVGARTGRFGVGRLRDGARGPGAPARSPARTHARTARRACCLESGRRSRSEANTDASARGCGRMLRPDPVPAADAGGSWIRGRLLGGGGRRRGVRTPRLRASSRWWVGFCGHDLVAAVRLRGSR